MSRDLRLFRLLRKSLRIEVVHLDSLRRRLERQAALPSALATPGSALELPKTPAADDLAHGQEFSATEQPAPEGLDLSKLKASLTEVDTTSAEALSTLPDVRELDENFDTAFQLSMNRGPLCAEPVIGMAYFFERVALNAEDMDISQGN